MRKYVFLGLLALLCLGAGAIIPSIDNLGNMTVVGNITDGGLSADSGQCVQLGTAGILAASGGACGGAGGSTPTILPSSPITVATPTANTWVIGCSTCVTATTTPNVQASSPIVSSGAGFSPVLSCATCVTAVTAGAPLSSSNGQTPAITCSTCLTTTTGVQSLNAGSNIVITAGTPNPTVATTNAPTFTGTVTSAGNIFTTVAAATPTASSVYIINDAGSTNGLALNVPTSSTNGFTFLVAHSSVGSISNAGLLTIANILDNGLTASECIGSDASKNLVSNAGCVLSVSGTGNISVTTGPTPAVSITNAPAFTGKVSMAVLNQSSASQFAKRTQLASGTVTFTFPATYGNTPVCVASIETATPTKAISVAVTKTTCIVTSDTLNDTSTVDIIVIGNPT